jgi:hypothetical protein
MHDAYVEVITFVERLHRYFLEVVKSRSGKLLSHWNQL